MATRQNRKRKEEEREELFLKKKQKISLFRRNAFLIINKMVELISTHPKVSLMDEILHSIFFLGKLNDPDFSPESIVSDDRDLIILKKLKECFPRPFYLYSSQLPKRSPLSCVLDMIVHLTGRENEDEIIRRMRVVIEELKKDNAKDLVSSTICVSQCTIPNSHRYYGVSMSTSDCYPGRIMVSASCLSSWDRYVADAVMTYYPTKNKEEFKKFDGTIKLPQHVRCETFSLSQGVKMPPCKSCQDLFGLTTNERRTQKWAYGHCAEAESLSNLLKNDEVVRVQAQPTSETCTDENRERVKRSLLTELRRLLRELEFKWDKAESFYTV